MRCGMRRAAILAVPRRGRTGDAAAPWLLRRLRYHRQRALTVSCSTARCASYVRGCDASGTTPRRVAWVVGGGSWTMRGRHAGMDGRAVLPGGGSAGTAPLRLLGCNEVSSVQTMVSSSQAWDSMYRVISGGVLAGLSSALRLQTVQVGTGVGMGRRKVHRRTSAARQRHVSGTSAARQRAARRRWRGSTRCQPAGGVAVQAGATAAAARRDAHARQMVGVAAHRRLDTTSPMHAVHAFAHL